MNPPSAFSPVKYARVGGVIYLVIIIAGIFGELFVRGKLVVPGDVTATASNIAASPMLWRLGIGADLIMQLCDIPLMLIFYVLMKPVNKNLALMCYLANSFALILYPSLNLFPYVLLPPFVAELGLALWLVVKGIDRSKWNQWSKE